MKYDFNAAPERLGSGSVKWDAAGEGVIPLWVADMDFPAAPPIQEALHRRVEHGVFGYARVPGAYFDAVVGWFRRRHSWTINPEWIIYTTGVVPAVSAVLQALTQPGDKVLVQTPVYNCFFSSIRNAGCQVLDAPLIYNESSYSIDFEAFERCAADEKCGVFLLCNPHNPAGRMWKPEELRRLGDICLRNNVVVVSDEIHCELAMPGQTFTPYATLGEDYAAHCVVCNSPSKNFNIAGLQVANIIVPDAAMRRRIDRAININEVCDLNPFGIEALIAAYNECADWLDQLNVYLWENYLLLREVVEQNLPRLTLTNLEATYLAWLNVEPLGIPADTLERRLKAEHGVWVNSGSLYGTDGFLRINLACPRATLREGLRRMVEGLKALSEQ